jgi:hypothetical protein
LVSANISCPGFATDGVLELAEASGSNEAGPSVPKKAVAKSSGKAADKKGKGKAEPVHSQKVAAMIEKHETVPLLGVLADERARHVAQLYHSLRRIEAIDLEIAELQEKLGDKLGEKIVV